MANIQAAAFVFKDIVLTFPANNYEKSVSQVEFSGTNPTAQWVAASPGTSKTFTGYADWTYTIVGAQDWEDEDSLANFALENETEEVEVSFQPVAGGATFTATITISVPTIGGTVNGVPVFTLTGGSTKPVPTAAE